TVHLIHELLVAGEEPVGVDPGMHLRDEDSAAVVNACDLDSFALLESGDGLLDGRAQHRSGEQAQLAGDGPRVAVDGSEVMPGKRSGSPIARGEVAREAQGARRLPGCFDDGNGHGCGRIFEKRYGYRLQLGRLLSGESVPDNAGVNCSGGDVLNDIVDGEL